MKKGSEKRTKAKQASGQEFQKHYSTEGDLALKAQLLDISGEAIFVWELDGSIEYWNNGGMMLYGYSQTDALGFVSHDLLKTVFPKSLDAIKAALKRDGQWCGELIHSHKDGHKIVVESLMKLVHQGNRLIVLETNHDITEHKKAEEALFRSKQLLENVFSAMNEGVVILDSVGNIIDFNESFAHICKFKNKEETLRSIDSFANLFKAYRLDGSPLPINEWAASRAIAGEVGIIENGAERTDTGERFILSSSYAPLKDEQGHIIGGIQVSVDITERKKSEEHIQKLLQLTQLEKERLLTVIDSIPDEVWIFDANGNVELVNAPVLKAFGSLVNIKEAAKINDVSEVYEPDRKKRQAADSPPLRALKGEVVIEQEEIVRIPNSGELRTRQVNAAPVRDDKGNVVGAVAIVHDITDQKRLEDDLKKYNETLENNVRKRTQELQQLNEALLKSNKELENFAYITSHDLQEPLRTITSFTQLLALKYDNQLDQDAKDYIRFVVSGAKHMHELINGLLIYSRISRKESVFSEVDLNKVIDEIRANLRLIIKERNCQINSSDLPVVFADKTQMIQLFQNLTENGIKFSSKNPHINISGREEGKNYVFSVKDEGIGIEPKYFDKIFEIFKRLHQRDEYPGTGIGLAICKKVVDNHN